MPAEKDSNNCSSYHLFHPFVCSHRPDTLPVVAPVESESAAYLQATWESPALARFLNCLDLLEDHFARPQRLPKPRTPVGALVQDGHFLPCIEITAFLPSDTLCKKQTQDIPVLNVQPCGWSFSNLSVFKRMEHQLVIFSYSKRFCTG
jgi:hypothetical protein